MNDAFEAYWALTGARYSTGDHKERARHAYEAGARSAAPRDAGRAEWLDVLEEKKPEMTFEEFRKGIFDTIAKGFGISPESMPPIPPLQAGVCPVCGSPHGEKCLSMEDLTYMDTPHPQRGEQRP